MARNTRDSLNLENALGRDALPLRDGLRRQSAKLFRKRRIASSRLLGGFESGLGYVECVFHESKESTAFR